MTSLSIAAGLLAALICGLVAGRCLRNYREGIAAAFLIAVAAGLTLLTISKLSDVLRIVQPRVAIDWLPLALALLLLTVVFPSEMFRIAIRVILAVLLPVRLLWGSVYLQADHINIFALMGIAIWAASLSVPMLLKDLPSKSRLNWRTTLWVLATAATVIVIALSGSLTYGVATGVCGLAILGTLISTSQIPGVAAFPLICLIGLSASFAALPVLTAGLLLLGWIGALISDQIQKSARLVAFRATTVVFLLLAGSLTVIRLTNNAGTAETPRLEYGTYPGNVARSSQTFKKERTTSNISDGDSSTTAVETSQQSGQPDDVFGGLDME